MPPASRTKFTLSGIEGFGNGIAGELHSLSEQPGDPCLSFPRVDRTLELEPFLSECGACGCSLAWELLRNAESRASAKPLAGSLGRGYDCVSSPQLVGCMWFPSKHCSLPRTLTTDQRLTGFCVLPEMQQFYASQSRLPDSRVVLCFGEEFPDTAPLRSKLILVQVRANGFCLMPRAPHPHLYGTDSIPG